MLNIYTYNTVTAAYDQISEAGAYTNPIRTTHEGTEGKTVTQKLFLRNNSSSYYYTGVSVGLTPTSLVEPGNIRNLQIKLVAGDREPTQAEWDSAVSGESIEINGGAIGSGSGANTNYFPFWLRVVVPKRTPQLSLADISLTNNYTEAAI